MNKPMLTNGIKVGPIDTRCRWWAKIVPEGVSLPLASAVQGASDVPGAYEQPGETHFLEVGDAVIMGEANHHVKVRGWSYFLWLVVESRKEPGVARVIKTRPDGVEKRLLAALGAPKAELAGSGELAGCVRILRALRSGVLEARDLQGLLTDGKKIEEVVAERRARDAERLAQK